MNNLSKVDHIRLSRAQGCEPLIAWVRLRQVGQSFWEHRICEQRIREARCTERIESEVDARSMITNYLLMDVLNLCSH